MKLWRAWTEMGIAPGLATVIQRLVWQNVHHGFLLPVSKDQLTPQSATRTLFEGCSLAYENVKCLGTFAVLVER